MSKSYAISRIYFEYDDSVALNEIRGYSGSILQLKQGLLLAKNSKSYIIYILRKSINPVILPSAIGKLWDRRASSILEWQPK